MKWYDHVWWLTLNQGFRVLKFVDMLMQIEDQNDFFIEKTRNDYLSKEN